MRRDAGDGQGENDECESVGDIRAFAGRVRKSAHVAGMIAAVGVAVLIAWRARESLAGRDDDARLGTDDSVAMACSLVASTTSHDPSIAMRRAIPIDLEGELVVVDDEYIPSDSRDDTGVRPVRRGSACGAASVSAFASRACGMGSTRGRPASSTQVSKRSAAPGTESYAPIAESEFQFATTAPLSTFSIDVDTASYSNVRRFLEQGQMPPVDAVRVEELVNYFAYTHSEPKGDEPFASQATVASCPWDPNHRLVQIGLRARALDDSRRAGVNLVFLIDVSGSMESPDKLPLLVRSLRLLVERLDARDRVAIVVYAGAAGLVLPSTTCEYKGVLTRALESLRAGGSTNGGEGLELAYRVAAENFLSHGQNRVVLCTDGDFNVGVSDHDALVRLIEAKRATGVFLSVLGFGTGNVQDSTMEMLADKGNGNYAYVDTIAEARKVLVNEMGGTLHTVAQDVKIQVEFNPAHVQAWRLIGYENRKLAERDFDDDAKDAGEIGAGHTVTALYEIVPVGAPLGSESVRSLRYAPNVPPSPALHLDELLSLKLRYKSPGGDASRLLTTTVPPSNASWAETGDDFRFAAAVAAFGMLLRGSPHVGSFDYDKVLYLAMPAVGADPQGTRGEFVSLVRRARDLAGR